MDPAELIPLFDADGSSPVELMTLSLFAAVALFAWLCPPCGGSSLRRVSWSAVWSLLAAMAIVRETDAHKVLFSSIWPDVAAGFKGTVFKMRFLVSADVPLAPKAFVLLFFVLFFAVVAIPLVRYFVPLVKGFFRMEPVAWTMATFGAVSVLVLVMDRLPAWLRHGGADGAALDKATGSVAALFTAFEEGGELLMALIALMAVVQSHLLFGRCAENDGR